MRIAPHPTYIFASKSPLGYISLLQTMKVLTAAHSNDRTGSFNTEGWSAGQLTICYGEKKGQEQGQIWSWKQKLSVEEGFRDATVFLFSSLV